MYYIIHSNIITKIDQNKTCLHTNNVKMENNEYKKCVLKIVRVVIFIT